MAASNMCLLFTNGVAPSSFNDPTFEIESFIGRRYMVLPNSTKKQLQYKVKWANYDDITWEPASNLLQDLGQISFNTLIKQHDSAWTSQKRKHCETKITGIKNKMQPNRTQIDKTPMTFSTKSNSAACNKATINAAIVYLLKKHRHTRCLVIDDPSSTTCMQTSSLIRNKIPNSTITAISSDPEIARFKSKFRRHKDEAVHAMSTDFLKSRIHTKVVYDMAFLDYCDTPSTTSKKYNWIEDLKLIFEHFLAPKGMIHITFSVRGFGHVHTFVQYMLDQHVPDAQIVGPYDYHDTQNMVVFTIVCRSDWHNTAMPFSIGRAIIPRQYEPVLVQMDDGTMWKGQFYSMVNSKVWNIFDPKENNFFYMDKDMVRRMSLIL